MYALSLFKKPWYLFRGPSLSLLVSNTSLFLFSLAPRVEPPFCSLRHRSFRVCHRTDATHQIHAPRGKRAHYSQYGHQGHGDILRSHILVPYLGCGHVLGNAAGAVLCTRTRDHRVLIIVYAFPAAIIGHSNIVSRPGTRRRRIYFSPTYHPSLFLVGRGNSV